MSLTGPEILRFAHYEVLRQPDGTLWELGKGGMGVTYKAFDTKLKVDVVLKLPHPHLMKSERNLRLFLREARAAAKVRHANIAAVIHLNDEEPYFYAMEFVPGRPLDHLLKERANLPPEEALDLLEQMAAALGALSGAQIVHRDIKPANLMLLADEDQPFGRLLKLIDFGLAKGFTVEGREAATYLGNSLSQVGVFTGTPLYASPEQCAGAADLDSRSDLYSAGVVCWQMLSGAAPFTGTLQQIIAKHQMATPPWETLSGVPEPVLELLRRLLAKEPTERFKTPRELREAIRVVLPRLSAERAEPLAVPMAQETTQPRSERREDKLLQAMLGAAMDVVLARRAEGVTVPAALEGSSSESPLGETPLLGGILAERYRLEEWLGEGDGGFLYRAVDLAGGEVPVAVKVLRAKHVNDQGFIVVLADQLSRARMRPNAVWLANERGVEFGGGRGLVAREWAEGFSLDELLRARSGELGAAEVWRLLETLPGAIDQAADEMLFMAEPLLRKLFVTPRPASSAQQEEWAALRARPLREWPDFALRWDPISFRSGEPVAGEIHTLLAEPSVSVTEDPAAALALLVRELLGGLPVALTPLPALRAEANAVLQRALNPSGEKAPFSSASDFWRELTRASDVVPAGAAFAAEAPSNRPVPPEVPAPDHHSADTGRPLAPSHEASSGQWRRYAFGVMFVVLLFLGWTKLRRDDAARLRPSALGAVDVAEPTPIRTAIPTLLPTATPLPTLSVARVPGTKELPLGVTPIPAPAAEPSTDLFTPSSLKDTAPETYKARFESTKGNFVMEVIRSQAPQGADRFFNLIKAGYYTDVAIFRVIPGFMVQFGIHGDPKLNSVWRKARIPDDQVKASNARGTITFATSGPGTSTVQVFINLVDNPRLDALGLAAFGKVVEGMDVVEKFNAEYGECAPYGPGPAQGRAQLEGNAYFKLEFPNLDYIKSAAVLP